MKKLVFRLIVLNILLFNFANIYSQNEEYNLPKSNFNLFSELTLNSLDELKDILTILGNEKIYKISIENGSDEKDFLLNTLRQKFSGNKIIYEKEDGFDYKILINNLKFKTLYSNAVTENIIGNEVFTRELKIEYSYSVSNDSGTTKHVIRTYKDKVKAEEIEYIENGSYTSMKSELPGKSFIKKAILPAIMITLSALTTILFFTIRSK